MSILIAQTMLFIAVAVGFGYFAYVHLFSAKFLHRHARKMARAEEGTAVALAAPDPGPSPALLFYERQQQIGRLLAAKIDIIRGAAETQNRILVLQARAVCDGTLAPPAPVTLIEHRAGDDPASPVTLVPSAELADPGRILRDTLDEVREAAGGHLDEIDRQIETLHQPLADAAA